MKIAKKTVLAVTFLALSAQAQDMEKETAQQSAFCAQPSKVALRSYNGHYVVAENGGGYEVNANRTAIGPWETFTLIDLNGGALMHGDPIALRSSGGYYVVAENGGGYEVNANRTAIGPWETFNLLFQ